MTEFIGPHRRRLDARRQRPNGGGTLCQHVPAWAIGPNQASQLETAQKNEGFSHGHAQLSQQIIDCANPRSDEIDQPAIRALK
jgi:hypothetical protein